MNNSILRIKNIVKLYVLISIVFISCAEEKKPGTPKEKGMQLTVEMAENLAVLPLKCLQKEFPNKLNQSLSSADEMGTPSELHPAFYGCYDWHSSVHGHWMLVSLLNKYPQISSAPQIKKILAENLTAVNIYKEVEYFNRSSEKSFERTYGWAWLLQLDHALSMSKDSIIMPLHAHLQPLTKMIVSRYLAFLPKLNYPIRSGEHPNTAFGMALAYDYAVAAKQDSLKTLIINRAMDFYQNDHNCPLTWEPSGFDFLSPCFQEADLMSRVLSAESFDLWLTQFLPQLADPAFSLQEAKVSDRTDGKLVHLDGVNFCRAWSMYHIAKVLPNKEHLIALANQHVDASLPNIIDGGYEGEHWLATFAVYALQDE